MNINMRNFGKNNTAIIHQAVDKMNKGNLEVSDILDSEELITDVKSSMSQLAQFFSEPQNIKNLIDYVIREPTEDEHKRGHKFPFNACEILCSDNPVIVSKLFDEHKVEGIVSIPINKRLSITTGVIYAFEESDKARALLRANYRMWGGTFSASTILLLSHQRYTLQGSWPWWWEKI